MVSKGFWDTLELDKYSIVSIVYYSSRNLVFFKGKVLLQRCHFAEMETVKQIIILIAVKEMTTNYLFHSLHPVHAVDFLRRERGSMQAKPGPTLWLESSCSGQGRQDWSLTGSYLA